MRIISGKYRGRLLQSPKGEGVRPTSDLVKESVFNVLQFRIGGSTFLDLFAGSGGIGLEAVSRGANKVIFADSSRESIRLAMENILSFVTDKESITNLKNKNFIKLDGCDIKIILSEYKSVLQMFVGEKFDFIFCDPPYEKDYSGEILKIVDEIDLLAEGGVVIFEHLFKKPLQNLPDGFIIEKERRYGTIAVSFVSRGEK